MTLAAIIAAVTEVAKLGTGGLDFWKQLHTTAATEIDKVAAHDLKLKPFPKETKP